MRWCAGRQERRSTAQPCGSAETPDPARCPSRLASDTEECITTILNAEAIAYAVRDEQFNAAQTKRLLPVDAEALAFRLRGSSGWRSASSPPRSPVSPPSNEAEPVEGSGDSGQYPRPR